MIGQVPTWVVDPLDGTVNYSHGLDNWGISIALIEADKVLEGVIFLPMQGRLMAAAAGRSHTPAVRGLESGVSATNNLGRSQVWTDWSKGDPGATLRILSILAQHTMYPQIRLCSTAAIVAVASGQIDAFVHPHPEIEDVAAGILIVEAAGGKATSLSGANWLNNPHEPIVFSNGVLHDRLLELLAAN